MGTEVIEKKLNKLPDNLKLKVEGYIDALLMEYHIDESATESTSFQVKAGFGGGKGIIGYMADDFDEPLEDFKDYM
ncbi:type II toxin-antitoxin system VapB family antitoxin [Mucilaginibacter ginsenosidivorax]|uniref:DUF2281 domain-containing protein n=1 Tax=Mucilaginibacter ginsenosidivorax TaxID=862126 RepID=A0A5B8W0X1_9SPHI|nr:DUF2281 domain-containing protein [Mucilaginibacter ginsenosidivorax]QEC77630.1 DUF2281 domain-containing protein [Mucilaginibacter ginsenosidivorax]